MLIIGRVWWGYFFFQCFWTPFFRFAFDITRQLRKRGGVAGLTLLHLKVSAPVQVSKDNSTEKETINVLICMLRAALRQLLGNLCIHFIHTPSCLSGKRNGATLCAVFEVHRQARTARGFVALSCTHAESHLLVNFQNFYLWSFNMITTHLYFVNSQYDSNGQFNCF